MQDSQLDIDTELDEDTIEDALTRLNTYNHSTTPTTDEPTKHPSRGRTTATALLIPTPSYSTTRTNYKITYHNTTIDHGHFKNTHTNDPTSTLNRIHATGTTNPTDHTTLIYTKIPITRKTPNHDWELDLPRSSLIGDKIHWKLSRTTRNISSTLSQHGFNTPTNPLTHISRQTKKSLLLGLLATTYIYLTLTTNFPVYVPLEESTQELHELYGMTEAEAFTRFLITLLTTALAVITLLHTFLKTIAPQLNRTYTTLKNWYYNTITTPLND